MMEFQRLQAFTISTPFTLPALVFDSEFFHFCAPALNSFSTTFAASRVLSLSDQGILRQPVMLTFFQYFFHLTTNRLTTLVNQIGDYFKENLGRKP